jgi:hypothetical protein
MRFIAIEPGLQWTCRPKGQGKYQNECPQGKCQGGGRCPSHIGMLGLRRHLFGLQSMQPAFGDDEETMKTPHGTHGIASPFQEVEVEGVFFQDGN